MIEVIFILIFLLMLPAGGLVLFMAFCDNSPKTCSNCIYFAKIKDKNCCSKEINKKYDDPIIGGSWTPIKSPHEINKDNMCPYYNKYSYGCY
jgi:hypothetical protein